MQHIPPEAHFLSNTNSLPFNSPTLCRGPQSVGMHVIRHIFCSPLMARRTLAAWKMSGACVVSWRVVQGIVERSSHFTLMLLVRQQIKQIFRGPKVILLTITELCIIDVRNGHQRDVWFQPRGGPTSPMWFPREPRLQADNR